MINQIVLGVAFNLVGYGLTTTLNRGFFNGLHVEDTFATDKMGMELSDRIGVIYEGEILEEMDRKDINYEKIGLLMAGKKDEADSLTEAS